MNVHCHGQKVPCEKLYKCQFCQRDFKMKKKVLELYVIAIHNKPNKELKCNWCEKTFAMQKNLLIHQRINAMKYSIISPFLKIMSQQRIHLCTNVMFVVNNI